MNKAEEEISEVLRRLREIESILNRSGAILFLWRNEENWPIEYVSNNISLFGYDPAAMMARHQPYGALIHPDDRHYVFSAMRTYMADGRQEYHLHYRIHAADGTVRWVDEHGGLIREENGRADAVQGVILDVSERHAAEEKLTAYRTRLETLVAERTAELETANRQLREDFARRREEELARLALEREVMKAREREVLERTERLSSLGFLAAGVAHEVNNPLQGMLSHLQAVRKALPPEFRRAESLDAVERGIESIAALVKRLLWLGTERETRDASARISDTLALVRELLALQLQRAHIRLALQDESHGRSVAMPGKKLVEVLLNLLLNARDAMPEGGVITVDCSTQGDQAVLSVADTGEGIPPDILPRIFSPFFTTKGRHGTGLGLNVADSLVRASRGRIDVESRPGEGAVFTVILPLARR